MKILITGATGFIGGHLMPLLKKMIPDADILTLNRDLDFANQKYPRSEYPNCQNSHASDLNSVIAFNPEISIHLATLTTPDNTAEIVGPMISANIEFGVLLLDTLAKCSNFQLFVNLGTFSEYGDNSGELNSATLYAASKTAFRQFVSFYASLHSFKYFTVVPYSVYGGDMTVKRVVDYLKESLGSDVPIKMTRGQQVLDFIHIDDVADFFVYIIKNMNLILELEKNRRVFFLGTGVGNSIKQCARLIEDKYEQRCNIEWGAIPYGKRDIMHAVAPLSRNSESIKWKASTKLADGI